MRAAVSIRILISAFGDTFRAGIFQSRFTRETSLREGVVAFAELDRERDFLAVANDG